MLSVGYNKAVRINRCPSFPQFFIPCRMVSVKLLLSVFFPFTGGAS